MKLDDTQVLNAMIADLRSSPMLVLKCRAVGTHRTQRQTHKVRLTASVAGVGE